MLLFGYNFLKLQFWLIRPEQDIKLERYKVIITQTASMTIINQRFPVDALVAETWLSGKRHTTSVDLETMTVLDIFTRYISVGVGL
jgi:hypothetical protein